jgi:hypothetical protein
MDKKKEEKTATPPPTSPISKKKVAFREERPTVTIPDSQEKAVDLIKLTSPTLSDKKDRAVSTALGSTTGAQSGRVKSLPSPGIIKKSGEYSPKGPFSPTMEGKILQINSAIEILLEILLSSCSSR